MTKVLMTAIIGLMLVGPAYAAHTEAEAQTAVATFAAKYLKLWNSKDAAGIAALFADDGLEIPPLPMVTGRDNIEKTFKATFDAGASNLRYDIKRVQADGDIVYAVGEFQVNLPLPGGSGLREIQGNFVSIYQWNGDGLLYRVHSFNFIPPRQ